MPMDNLLALRLGRPDLAGLQGSVSADFGSASGVSAALAPTSGGGASLTGNVAVGRAGLTILIIVVGAMAISYVTTRRIQF